jgi:FeS assembly SUF system protein
MTAEEKESLHEEIVEAIQTCYDPEIPVDIYKLGLIYGIDVSDEADVRVRMTLTSPNCPAAQSLPEEVKRKTAEVEGVRSAEVEIVFDPPWTMDKMDDAAKLVLNIL